MNRNRDKTTELFFDLIKIKFDLGSQSVLPADFYEPRWVQGSKDDAQWLTRSTIKSKIELSHEVRFCITEYNLKKYFVSTGLEEPQYIPNGLSPININPGLFVAIITELELPVKTTITNLYLEQNILSQNKSQTLYEGHELGDLTPIFPPVVALEITAQYPGHDENIEQLICTYFANNKNFIVLPYSMPTLNKINDLVLSNSKILNYSSVFQSMVSSQFKFAFLDLYRCIEMLYQVIYVDDTHKKLSLTIKRSDLLSAIDAKLSWRPNERNALKKVFAETPHQNLESLKIAVRKIDPKIGSISDWLYDLRCNIVHLKSDQKTFSMNNSQWDNLILGITDILIFWYQKYITFD